MRDADVVLDCTDNVATRYLLSDACAILGVAARLRRRRQPRGTTLRVLPRQVRAGFGTRLLPPIRLLTRLATVACFPHLAAAGDSATSCARGGVLGPVPGVMGTMQALEAIKVMTGLGDAARPAGRLPHLRRRVHVAPVRLRASSREKSKRRRLRRRPEGDGEDVGGVRLRSARASATACTALASRTPRDPALERRTANDTRAPFEFPPELDDAAAAYLRNVRDAAGDGAAPWGVDDDASRAEPEISPERVAALRMRRSRPSRVSLRRRWTVRRKPPLPARAEAPHRVTPASLHAAIKANACVSTGEPYVLVVDVRRGISPTRRRRATTRAQRFPWTCWSRGARGRSRGRRATRCASQRRATRGIDR